ncbi:hypothetical protein [Novosphingobium sp. 9]|uniref:hypothetical protein n=1 Tax=Novosphingobium sp. 9 TaxID=2025349 RepID=UPI0021B5729F|nr:hypothetical protein [Novosphingobium sp. 9]
MKLLDQLRGNPDETTGSAIDVDPLKTFSDRAFDRLHKNGLGPLLQQPRCCGTIREKTFRDYDQFVASRHQARQLMACPSNVELQPCVFRDDLKGGQFRIRTPRKADHPLAVQCQRDAQLVLRDSRPRHAQECARRSLSRNSRLGDGEQSDTQW